MSERTEFNKQGEEILDFFDNYSVLRHEHLEKFFPRSKKVISYLVKNQRLYKSSNGVYISTDQDTRPDKCLIASLGVLADIYEKVQSHVRATAPVQISFITYTNDYYEIIYVGYGMDAMVIASFETQLAARKHDNSHAETAKRIIIVEDASQMKRLRIPGTTRFALVLPDGSLTYYRA